MNKSRNDNLDESIFCHLVITRLNIKPVDLVTGDILRTDFEHQWMEDRISYLRDYCLPSILNQECNDFEWIVYMDSNTEKKYKLAVDKIVKTRNCRSHLEFTDSALTFVSDLRNISKKISCQSKYLITTRLDSDDALHKGAVTRIQKAFQELIESEKIKSKIAINLLCGYQLRIKPFYELVFKRCPSNPFISLIEESSDDLETIYTYFHNDLRGIGIVDILDGSYWLQTIHSSNMTTNVIGWPYFRINELEDFGIDTSKIEIAPHVFLYSLYTRISASLLLKLKIKS